MDEIKVGQYVRLARCQGINKIIDIDEDGFLILDDNIADEYGDECCQISPQDADEEIVNHSFNLKELIEVGDIIEWEWKEFGYYGINEVINRFGTIGVYPEEYDEVISLKDIKIKSILTHEQYERECYRLEDN